MDGKTREKDRRKTKIIKEREKRENKKRKRKGEKNEW